MILTDYALIPYSVGEMVFHEPKKVPCIYCGKPCDPNFTVCDDDGRDLGCAHEKCNAEAK